jgi:hypothetical protein
VAEEDAVNIGERHVMEGDEEYEVVSRGTYNDDGEFNVVEGRIPAEGEEGLLLQSEQHPENIYWLERVEVVDARNRMARLEMAMDELMPNVRAELLRFENPGTVPLDDVARLMRAACAAGYEFAQREDPPGALEASFD